MPSNTKVKRAFGFAQDDQCRLILGGGNRFLSDGVNKGIREPQLAEEGIRDCRAPNIARVQEGRTGEIVDSNWEVLAIGVGISIIDIM